MMKRRYYLIVWVSLISIAIGWGLIYRNSFYYQDVSTAICEEAVVMTMNDDYWWTEKQMRSKYMPYSSLKEMAIKSDSIAIVTAIDERIKKDDCILTKFEINNVLKGSFNERFCYIYEPVEIFMSNKGEHFMYASPCGYALMTLGERYLVFLESKEQPQGYIYKNNIEENSYLLVNFSFGKYPLKQLSTDEIFAKIYTKENPSFVQVKDMPLLCSNDEILNLYAIWWEEAIELVLILND